MADGPNDSANSLLQTVFADAFHDNPGNLGFLCVGCGSGYKKTQHDDWGRRPSLAPPLRGRTGTLLSPA
ncbi:MAG: hypothetical protein DRH08_01120 [Deltaproteobacteria bacterium]|nr:MAG: hypothetical protein DRH08_01120 [Deltaproteobacteria bacterium]